MKRDSLKRNIFLSLILLTCASAIVPAYAVNTTVIDTTDQEYMREVTQNIKALISEIENKIEAFKKGEARTIDTAIAFFESKVKEINTNLITPLKNKVAEHTHRSSSTYYKALKATDDLVTELHKHLIQFQRIIKNPDNLKTALMLANKLHEQKEKLATKFNLFDQQLTQLHTYMQELELAAVAEEIHKIRLLVKQAKIDHARPVSNAEKAKIVAMINEMFFK